MIGKDIPAARVLADNYLRMVSGKEYDSRVDLEEAEVYAGVKQFPARVKCASIAWQAFVQSIDQK